MDLKKSDYKKIKRVVLDLSELREIKPLSLVDTLAELVKQERFIGRTGEIGPQGIQGIHGITGANGLQGIPGERGHDGAKGEDGLDGKRGALWFSGKGKPKLVVDSNENDLYLDETTGDIYKLVGTVWIFVTNVKGPKGDKGEKGAPGKNGVDGKAGKNGADGKNGVNGKNGKDGKQGEKGERPKHQWSGTKLRFENVDGSWGEWTDLRSVSSVIRGATTINNISPGGNDVITLSVGPGNTINLDQYVTNSFRQAEYFINIYDATDSKNKGLKLFVLKTDLTPTTQIYARTGDIIPVSVDASFSGLNTNVFLTNNSLNTLEIKYSRIVI